MDVKQGASVLSDVWRISPKLLQDSMSESTVVLLRTEFHCSVINSLLSAGGDCFFLGIQVVQGNPGWKNMDITSGFEADTIRYIWRTGSAHSEHLQILVIQLNVSWIILFIYVFIKTENVCLGTRTALYTCWGAYSLHPSPQEWGNATEVQACRPSPLGALSTPWDAHRRWLAGPQTNAWRQWCDYFHRSAIL